MEPTVFLAVAAWLRLMAPALLVPFLVEPKRQPGSASSIPRPEERPPLPTPSHRSAETEERAAA